METTTTQCTFDEAWMGRCKSPAVAGSDKCEKHKGLKCVSCGKPATRECDHTGIQFVCGSPLCGECRHGIPSRENPGIFNLGGGHHPRAVVEQQWRELRAREDAERSAFARKGGGHP